jgi:hypothetical protein
MHQVDATRSWPGAAIAAIAPAMSKRSAARVGRSRAESVGPSFVGAAEITSSPERVARVPRPLRSFVACALVLAGSLVACTKGAPPASLLDSGVGAASVKETITLSPSSSVAASTSSSVAAADAGDAAPVDELQARAKKLFEAIQRDEPDLAMAFFFPRDAYLAMKDVKDPAASWDKIAKDYKLRIHTFHKQLGRKASEAEFDAFELNTKSQVYVAPKKELNKTGYNRVGKSKLRFKLKGKPRTFDVAVMIDNEGKWFVLHLK